MLRTTTRLATLTGAALILVACGRSEPEPVVVSAPAPAPIYAKDGSIVPQETVVNQNGM